MPCARAKRKRWFLERARAALGHPIEIISGLEEARLIYSGVVHTSPMSPDKRLVIDIGGGSTEVVIGEGFNPLLLESLSVGCVGLSTICFDDGKISEKRFERARTAVRLELEPIQEAYRKLGWLQAFGSSGTVRVIGDVLRRLNPDSPRITLDNLNVARGARHRRRAMWMSWICRMWTRSARRYFRPDWRFCWKSSRTSASTGFAWRKAPCAKGCSTTSWAASPTKTRACAACAPWKSAITSMKLQADRVEATAVAPARAGRVRMGPGRSAGRVGAALGRAAARNAAWTSPTPNINGTAPTCCSTPTCRDFPREEQLLLSALVGGHRRQLSFESLEDLLPPWDRLAEFLIVLLRLAVLLHRGRSPQPLPEVQLAVKGRNMTLELPQRWMKEHPLTLEDLEQERVYLKEAGFRLNIV